MKLKLDTLKRNKAALLFLLLMLNSILSINAKEKTRDVQFLTDGWYFQFNDIEKFSQVSFKSPKKWENISIPHTWNNKDGQDGGGDYKAGVAWYHTEFLVNGYIKNKDQRNLYIQFDAVNRDAEIYINGKLVGKHVGGYSMFRFKINEYVTSGLNKLAVKVRNYARTKANSLPNRADYTFFGGIYRKVSLITTDKLTIAALDYAGLGTYIKQKKVNENNADLEILTQISNDYKNTKKVTVKFSVFDAEGKLVESVHKEHSIKRNTVDISEMVLSIKNPHLWQGLEDPYLYKAQTEIFSEGKLIDKVIQNLGLRYYHVDPEKGFFLNGKHLKLKGVNKHQDRLNKGWAISEDDIIEDMNIIKEMGVNSMRLAHYQHDQKVYDICDKMGLITWAEIPYVDYMQDNPEFFENAKQQLTELIKQNFHHSSILFWSIGNETKAAENGTPAVKLLNFLNPIVKQLDDTRLSIYAHNGSPTDEKLYVTDVVGWNRYMGWYSSTPKVIGSALDRFHRENPQRAVSLSEYGFGASVIQHTENFTEKVDPRGPWHPEEYQSYCHEVYLKAINERDFVFASWLWNMYDFAADQRAEGDTNGRNDKGLVTYDRKVKKDAFYLYKAHWSEEPVCYITSRRFTERKQKETYLKIYSNCEEVEGFVNGKSIGTLKGQDKVFLWNKVVLQQGENKIQVKGKLNGQIYTDECVWFWDGKEQIQTKKIVDKTKIQASNFHKDFKPQNVYDRKTSTRWSVKGLNEWIQIDLENKEKVLGLEIHFANTKNRAYTIDIEVSEDGPFWEKVISEGKTRKDEDGYVTFKFKTPVTVQYVRVYNKGNSQNEWLAINEIQVLK